MLSICLIYSNERLPQATQVVEYLQMLKYYEAFDLIQVCDGDPNIVFTNFRPLIINRRNPQFFCRADLWNNGIDAATKNIVIILDCDRLPHPLFFNMAATLKNNHILYCEKLYQLWRHEPLPKIIKHFTGPVPLTIAKPDFRVTIDDGTIKPAKNPMSGCVAFWKKDYQATGGMSPDFMGWGFNDTDYYYTAYMYGLKFDAAPLSEFHLYHSYTISHRRHLAMNVWNAIRFYDKWRIPIHYDIYNIVTYLGTTVDFIRTIPFELFLEMVE